MMVDWRRYQGHCRIDIERGAYCSASLLIKRQDIESPTRPAESFSPYPPFESQ